MVVSQRGPVPSPARAGGHSLLLLQPLERLVEIRDQIVDILDAT